MTDVDRLRQAPFEVVGQFADASNATLLVQFVDRAPVVAAGEVRLGDLPADDLAVYKPRRGEAPLWDFPDGTLHLREVAAYLVSELLGWDLVPETVLRDDGPFGAGSVQRFVQHDPNRHYFALLEEGRPDILAQLQRMVVFDIVIDNADRKGGHVLVEDVDGRDCVRLVDHGVSFHAEPKLRTVGWDFAGQPIPDELGAAVATLARREGEVRSHLADLLAPPEIDALIARTRAFAGLGTFPRPIGPRPFPWPLV